MQSHDHSSELRRTNHLIRSLRIPSIVFAKTKIFLLWLRTFFDRQKSIRKVVSGPEFHLSVDKVLFSSPRSSDRSLRKIFVFNSTKLDHGKWRSKNSTVNTQRAMVVRLLRPKSWTGCREIMASEITPYTWGFSKDDPEQCFLGVKIYLCLS